MKMLKFLVSAVASTALVVGIGCSSTSTKSQTSRYMGSEDRVVTTQDTAIRTDTYQAPMAVEENRVIVVESAPAPAPAFNNNNTFTERVAKADRN